MDIDQTEIDRLVAGPAETRDVEIKAWIDPRTPEGKVKLLTALLALRNFNGGRLVIGFHNKNHSLQRQRTFSTPFTTTTSRVLYPGILRRPSTLQ